jgi:hypothetical protein
LEDDDHIFFRCHLARFLWAGVRELLPCSWNLTGVGDFITIAQGLSATLRRIAWFTFAALCLSLWNIHNKLAMEGKTISNPVDALYKMSIYIYAELEGSGQTEGQSVAGRGAGWG